MQLVVMTSSQYRIIKNQSKCNAELQDVLIWPCPDWHFWLLKINPTPSSLVCFDCDNVPLCSALRTRYTEEWRVRQGEFLYYIEEKLIQNKRDVEAKHNKWQNE